MRCQIWVTYFMPIVHYGRFWDFFPQNLDMNFESSGLIYAPILQFQTSDSHKIEDLLSDFIVFEIRAEIQAEVLRRYFQKTTTVVCSCCFIAPLEMYQ